MKRFARITSICLIITLLLTSTAVTTLADVNSGWQLIDGSWYYYTSNGEMTTGWQKVGNTWYYMNESGEMQTGWVKDGDIWYYMNTSGAMQTGWVKVGNTWYYMNTSGAMQTGWVKVGNTWYYMSASGAMQTGWVLVDDTWYYMASSGAMQTGWQKINGIWYYLKPSGAMAAKEWCNSYWLNADGSWTYPARGYWYINKYGLWFEDDYGWYPRNETVKIDGYLFDFDERGYLIEDPSIYDEPDQLEQITNVYTEWVSGDKNNLIEPHYIISWPEIPNAEKYEIEISNSNGVVVDYFSVDHSPYDYMVSDSDPSGFYQIRVRGTSEKYWPGTFTAGYVIIPQERYIKEKLQAPEELEAEWVPGDLTEGTTPQVVISWNENAKAESYEVRIKTPYYTKRTQEVVTNSYILDISDDDKSGDYEIGVCAKGSQYETSEESIASVTIPEERYVNDPVLKYSYEIIPLLYPFNNYFLIKTDNPDPDTFEFVDKTSIYSENGGTIKPVSQKYADVVYENEETLRVHGGYIARGSSVDGGDLVLVRRKVVGTHTSYNLSTGETTYVKDYSSKETDLTFTTISGLMNATDYLIHTYADGESDFFAKMDAVQSGLDSIALYYSAYVLGELKLSENYPYYGLSTSPHVDQTFIIQGPYYREDNIPMFISNLYPFILDSLGFPGTLGAVAKKLDSSAEVKQSENYHYLINVTHNGVTRSYGGAGNGGGQGINESDILYYFRFDGSMQDAAASIRLDDLKSRLNEYGQLEIDQDAGKTIPPLTWNKIRKDVGEGAYARVIMINSVMGSSGTCYTYFYENCRNRVYDTDEGTVSYMSNAWFDGRYFNRHEYYYPGATFEQTVEDVQPAIVLKDVSIPIPNDGNEWYFFDTLMEDGRLVSRERTIQQYGYDFESGVWKGYVRYSYDAASNSWIATKFLHKSGHGIYCYAPKAEYLENEEFLDAITITMDEALEMNLDRNTNIPPSEFLIYDRTEEPGTRGTN